MLFKDYSKPLPFPPEARPWLLRLSWASISLLLLAALTMGGLKPGTPSLPASRSVVAGLQPG